MILSYLSKTVDLLSLGSLFGKRTRDRTTLAEDAYLIGNTRLLPDVITRFLRREGDGGPIDILKTRRSLYSLSSVKELILHTDGSDSALGIEIGEKRMHGFNFSLSGPDVEVVFGNTLRSILGQANDLSLSFHVSPANIIEKDFFPGAAEIDYEHNVDPWHSFRISCDLRKSLDVRKAKVEISTATKLSKALSNEVKISHVRDYDSSKHWIITRRKTSLHYSLTNRLTHFALKMLSEVAIPLAGDEFFVKASGIVERTVSLSDYVSMFIDGKLGAIASVDPKHTEDMFTPRDMELRGFSELDVPGDGFGDVFGSSKWILRFLVSEKFNIVLHAFHSMGVITRVSRLYSGRDVLRNIRSSGGAGLTVDIGSSLLDVFVAIPLLRNPQDKFSWFSFGLERMD